MIALGVAPRFVIDRIESEYSRAQYSYLRCSIDMSSFRAIFMMRADQRIGRSRREYSRRGCGISLTLRESEHRGRQDNQLVQQETHELLDERAMLMYSLRSKLL